MSKEKVHRKRILSPRTIKFIAFAIAVIIQLAVLLVPYLFFRDYLKHINWIFEIVSFIIVLYIVKSDINPVYKIPWIVIIFVFPIFGGVLYLIYGVRHFGKKEVAKAMKMSKDYKQAIRSRQYYNDELRMIDEQISVQTDYLLTRWMHRCTAIPVPNFSRWERICFRLCWRNCGRRKNSFLWNILLSNVERCLIP